MAAVVANTVAAVVAMAVVDALDVSIPVLVPVGDAVAVDMDVGDTGNEHCQDHVCNCDCGGGRNHGVDEVASVNCDSSSDRCGITRRNS